LSVLHDIDETAGGVNLLHCPALWPHPSGFTRLRYLVMDEADRLMDKSFEPDLSAAWLSVLPQENRQTLLFSATLTASLVKLQQTSLEDAYVFQVGGSGVRARLSPATLFMYSRIVYSTVNKSCLLWLEHQW